MYGVESRTKPGAIEGQMELDDLLTEYQNGLSVGRARDADGQLSATAASLRSTI